jgi:hypothetical protein
VLPTSALSLAHVRHAVCKNMRGTRRALLTPSRALLFCLSLWLARVVIGTPTLGIA